MMKQARDCEQSNVRMLRNVNPELEAEAVKLAGSGSGGMEGQSSKQVEELNSKWARMCATNIEPETTL